jgi:hypothetical protein
MPAKGKGGKGKAKTKLSAEEKAQRARKQAEYKEKQEQLKRAQEAKLKRQKEETELKIKLEDAVTEAYSVLSDTPVLIKDTDAPTVSELTGVFSKKELRNIKKLGDQALKLGAVRDNFAQRNRTPRTDANLDAGYHLKARFSPKQLEQYSDSELQSRIALILPLLQDCREDTLPFVLCDSFEKKITNDFYHIIDLIIQELTARVSRSQGASSEEMTLFMLAEFTEKYDSFKSQVDLLLRIRHVVLSQREEFRGLPLDDCRDLIVRTVDHDHEDAADIPPLAAAAAPDEDITEAAPVNAGGVAALFHRRTTKTDNKPTHKGPIFF